MAVSDTYSAPQLKLIIIKGAGTPITSARLYSGAHTDDLRQALFYISTLYPKAPLLGIGFSLGANVMTRYLSEEGINSRLRSGCILGCVSVVHYPMIKGLTTTFIITALGSQEK